MSSKPKCELLLPVADMPMCLAAIHNGADAIYVGMPFFNARGRTDDLSLLELKEMIELCHLYGVKVHLAFNILIFEREFKKVIELLEEVIPLSPDAFIVQDLGLARLIKTMAPTQVLHGSTQMTVTNHEAISFLDELEIKRFVLGREVSIPEIKLIKEHTKKSTGGSGKELEVFVHGALCVAYSGQCFTSERIGGRSANRGQCAQSCRFEYQLLVDGEKRDLGDKKYLVSPKDLCGISQIPLLADLEIESFKVEGRLKTPEYVAATGLNYRAAIDGHFGKKFPQFIEKAKREMGLTYSRGFYEGWLNGVNHQELVDGTFGAHRGIEIGLVETVLKNSVKIKFDLLKNRGLKLKKGDGILLAGFFKGKKIEIGGMLYGIESNELLFSKGIDLSEVKKDFKVYFNKDSELDRELSKTYTDKNQKKRIPIDLKIEAVVGKHLFLEITDGTHFIHMESEFPLEASLSNPTTILDLKKELGALSATCFILDKVEIKNNQDFFIHQKELKILRRKFTEELMNLRIKRSPPEMYSPVGLLKQNKQTENKACQLNVLLRDILGVKDLLKGITETGFLNKLGVIYLDFEFGQDYQSSVTLLKAAGLKVGIATTRILKPNEYHHFKVIERACPDVILCRNLGAIWYFLENDVDKKFELKGDFSLNITNSLSANYFLNKNLKTLCASYDLNSEELVELLKGAPASKMEVTVHQYMPSFHMEHCVFAAFLSTGTSFKDCGRPCEKHKVELIDQFGHHHHIRADQECRNTMYNKTASTLENSVLKLKNLGVKEFRIEFLYERGEELKNKLLSYLKLI